MLQQRGYYTIKLGDGKKIPLRFCTWTFMRFCELNGNLTLSQLQDSLTGMTLSGFASLLLCAAEYVAVKENKELNYTKMDATEWIDEMGGIAGAGFSEMLAVIIASFTDNSNGQEKKIPATQKS